MAEDKHRDDVLKWVETGDIETDFYHQTQSMMFHCMLHKYASILYNKDDLREELASQSWVYLSEARQSYLNSELKWSTFVYYTVKRTMNRHYHILTKTIKLPVPANDVLIKYKILVTSGKISHEEFVKNLKKGEYGHGYKSEKALQAIMKTIHMQPINGKLNLQNGDNNEKEFDRVSELMSVASHEESVYMSILASDIQRLIKQSIGSDKRKHVCADMRILPLLLGGPAETLQTTCEIIGVTRERVRQICNEVIDRIRGNKELLRAIKEYRDSLNNVRGGRYGAPN